MTTPPRSAPTTTRARPADPGRRHAMRTIGGVGLLAGGCGGGTDLAGVGSGGTGQVATYSTGAISGFGSVIVNGVRYDDSAAGVTDDAGRTRSLSQLAIGMVIEVDGRGDDSAGTAVADRIRVVSELRGTVASIDLAARRFVVLGVTVQVGVATAFADGAGLAALRVGDAVEVHGFVDREAGVVRATLVERRTAGDATPAYKLRGVIRDNDAAAGTFRVGTLTIDVRGSTLTGGAPQDGRLVRIEGSNPPSGTTWRPAGEIAVLQPTLASGVSLARVEGTITDFVSASSFRVAGIPVDASGASFEGGASAASLAAGVRVRVRGTASGGRLLARTIEVRADDDVSGSGDDDVELKGTIVRFTRLADFAVRDAAGRVFLVDATAVTAATIEGGSLADLRVGVRVEVRGRRGLVILATRLKLET